jgi:hypothetical protein
MTFSELFMTPPKSKAASPACLLNRAICAVTAMTRYEPRAGHYRGRWARSQRWPDEDPLFQQLQTAAPAQTTGRRVGAGAGATPVFVALVRHDTSLVRSLSLGGRSRTCPCSLILNLNEIRIENKSSPRSKRHGNSHS